MKLAITGVGIVSPLGNTLSENIDNLKSLQVAFPAKGQY